MLLVCADYTRREREKRPAAEERPDGALRGKGQMVSNAFTDVFKMLNAQCALRTRRSALEWAHGHE